jgi:linoleoyl-CoA desaturase
MLPAGAISAGGHLLQKPAGSSAVHEQESFPVMSNALGSPTAGLMEQIAPTPALIARARARLHAKAVVIASAALASYWVLVVTHVGVLARLAAALVLTTALVAVATSIMHDANHSAFMRSARLNRLVGCTADLLGASSALWRFTHNNLHHGNTNVAGVDPDIDQAPFGRLTPEQPWRPWHRYQHVYMWFLYGFLALRWFLIADFVELAHPSRSRPAVRRPHRADAAKVMAGKALHFSWALLLPFAFHRWWMVLTFYLACSWLLGFSLAVVFQLAHCSGAVEFSPADTPRRGGDFVLHQLNTTADVRCTTPVVGAAFAWLAGGLHHQIEHHLAPRLPHTIYPIIAARLRRTCRERGLPYHLHASIGSAIASHARWLRQMGRPPAPVPVPLPVEVGPRPSMRRG